MPLLTPLPSCPGEALPLLTDPYMKKLFTVLVKIFPEATLLRLDVPEELVHKKEEDLFSSMGVRLRGESQAKRKSRRR